MGYTQCAAQFTMKLLLASCLSLLAASPALSKCLGSITVKDYGEVFIVAPDWSAGNIDIHDNGFTLRGNSRMYFANRCDDGWNGDMYAQVRAWHKVERNSAVAISYRQTLIIINRRLNTISAPEIGMFVHKGRV